MDKVWCPYCGAEMEWSRTYYSGLMPGEHVTFWWECECGAKSPARESDDDAFAVAMRRWQKPNRALAADEVTSGEIVAAWEENRRYPIDLGGWTLCSNEEPAMEHYGTGWRMWLRRPTDEERENTPWA